MKKIPIGIDDFKKIRENDIYYIDKTKYIEHEWISADCEPVQRCGQCHFSGWKTAGSQQVIRCPEGVMGPIQGESGEPGPETGFPEAGGLYKHCVLLYQRDLKR